MRLYSGQIVPEMNQEIALFIKDLRVNKEYSWRSVHKAFQVVYIDPKDYWKNASITEAFENSEELRNTFKYDPEAPHGHQIDGRDLCDAAMEFLGELENQGWN